MAVKKAETEEEQQGRSQEGRSQEGCSQEEVIARQSQVSIH